MLLLFFHRYSRMNVRKYSLSSVFCNFQTEKKEKILRENEFFSETPLALSSLSCYNYRRKPENPYADMDEKKPRGTGTGPHGIRDSDRHVCFGGSRHASFAGGVS